MILWAFPKFWYTQTDVSEGYHWLTPSTNLAGWRFQSVPVSRAAEALLVADRLVSGDFSGPEGETVRVFSAKRYVESGNEIGLFVHTPDRCWTETGWRMEPVQPECTQLVLQGIAMTFERRIFVAGDQRELVYFGGLVGGQPLPYRLDHNLSVGMKHALHNTRDATGTTLRASDRRFWLRIWESFRSRRPLKGPKQFIRVSTPVPVGEEERADALLRDFLPQWLKPADYGLELKERGSHR